MHLKYLKKKTIIPTLSIHACGSIDIACLGGVAHRIKGVRDIANALRLFAHLYLGTGRRHRALATNNWIKQIDEEAIDMVCMYIYICMYRV